MYLRCAFMVLANLLANLIAPYLVECCSPGVCTWTFDCDTCLLKFQSSSVQRIEVTLPVILTY
jgi:hypothetical protein